MAQADLLVRVRPKRPTDGSPRSSPLLRAEAERRPPGLYPGHSSREDTDEASPLLPPPDQQGGGQAGVAREIIQVESDPVNIDERIKFIEVL